jgi:hypothetical protein
VRGRTAHICRRAPESPQPFLSGFFIHPSALDPTLELCFGDVLHRLLRNAITQDSGAARDGGQHSTGIFSTCLLTPILFQVAAKFPLVTLEKWEGSEATPFIWEEDAWVAAAKQIKSINPNTSVVVWLDSFRICEIPLPYHCAHSPGYPHS